ncbi:MAG: putative porin [Candidatus Sericytochromatia bacterium]
MRNKNKIFTKILIITLIFLLLPKESYAEVKYNNLKENNTINILNELQEKYNIKISNDKTFLTRKEIALLLIQVLEKIPNDKLTFIEKNSIENIKKEYKDELNSIFENIQSLQDQVDINTSNIERIDNSVSLLNNAINFKLFGSIAFRNCFMSNDVLTQPQNILKNIQGNVFQTRIAGGITGKFVDSFNYQLRIFTGDVNSFNLAWYPFSANITRLPFVFDRFFIGYQPSIFNNANNKFTFTIGKSNNVFPETELFFDEDVSFNGFTQQYIYSDKNSWLQEASLSLSENILTVEAPYNNSFVIGGKGSLEIKPIDNLKFRIASSYVGIPGGEKTALYQFLQGYQGDTGKKNRLSVSPNTFSNKFNLFDSFAKLTYFINKDLPLDIFGDFVYNFGSPDKNKGYLVGANIGNFNKKGDWFISYNYKVLEQDYNLSYLVQEQMGGTDVSGHQIDFGYQIAENTKVFFTSQTRNNLSDSKVPTLFIFYTNIRQDF